MRAVNWDNVLVLQTSFLGDMVLTLPLIAEIRRRFPVKKLSLMCTPLGEELLQDHPAIDEIIVDDKKNYIAVGGDCKTKRRCCNRSNLRLL